MKQPNFFRHSVYIGLNYVDVAGVIFFPKLYEMTQQTFEAFFLPSSQQKHLSANAKERENAEKISNLSQFIHSQNIFPLVVHSESDYFLPIRHSDEVDILMNCTYIGRSSFTLYFQFFLSGDGQKPREERELVASAKVIHALVNAKTYQSVPINHSWHQKLSLLFDSVQNDSVKNTENAELC